MKFFETKNLLIPKLPDRIRIELYWIVLSVFCFRHAIFLRGAVGADTVTVQFNLFAVIITSWLNRPSRLSEGFHSAGGLTFGLIKKTWSPRFQKSLGHTLLRAWESPSRSPGYFHQSSGGSVFLFWPICFHPWNDLKLREGRNVCWTSERDSWNERFMGGWSNV